MNWCSAPVNSGTAAYQTDVDMGAGVGSKCNANIIQQGFKNVTVACPTKIPYKYTQQVPRTVMKSVPYQRQVTDYKTEIDQVPYTDYVNETKMVNQSKQVPVTTYKTVTTQVPVQTQRPVTRYRSVPRKVAVPRTVTEYKTVKETVYDTLHKIGFRKGTKACSIKVPNYSAKCPLTAGTEPLPADAVSEAGGPVVQAASAVEEVGSVAAVEEKAESVTGAASVAAQQAGGDEYTPRNLYGT